MPRASGVDGIASLNLLPCGVLILPGAYSIVTLPPAASATIHLQGNPNAGKPGQAQPSPAHASPAQRKRCRSRYARQSTPRTWPPSRFSSTRAACVCNGCSASASPTTVHHGAQIQRYRRVRPADAPCKGMKVFRVTVAGRGVGKAVIAKAVTLFNVVSEA